MKDLKVNGQSYSKNWLSHQELIKGTKLSFDMSEEPNKQRGIEKQAIPYSMTNELNIKKK